MKSITETYFVLKNVHMDTYVKDIGTGLTDAWGDVKTAERFDTEEEAARFRKAKIEYPDEVSVVCVAECVCVSYGKEPPPTAEERIRAILRRYFEFDDNGDANAEHDPDFTAQSAIDEIHDIVGTI